MPRFHFPLLSLLRIRKMLERQQYLALQYANQRVAASQQRIVDATSSLRSSLAAWMTAVSAGITSAELQFVRDCEHNCRLAIARAQQEHSKLVTRATAEREAYLVMQRQSKVVQHLHDRALETWQQEEARREQQKVDELFLMRLRMDATHRERPRGPLSGTGLSVPEVVTDSYRQEQSRESAAQVNS